MESWYGFPECQWWHSRRPLQQYNGIDYEAACEDISDDVIVVPQNQFHFTDEEKAELFSDIGPLKDDGDSGKKHFCDARSRRIDSLVQ